MLKYPNSRLKICDTAIFKGKSGYFSTASTSGVSNSVASVSHKNGLRNEIWKRTTVDNLATQFVKKKLTRNNKMERMTEYTKKSKNTAKSG